MEVLVLVLFIMAVIIWVAWLIGFPIYNKHNENKPLCHTEYSLVLFILVIVIQILNAWYQLC